MTNPTPSPLPKSGEPIVSELDKAIEKWDINRGMMTHELQTIADAARRVANLDYEAAEEVLQNWNPETTNAKAIVDAALGITTEEI